MILQKTYRIGFVLSLIALLLYSSGVKDLFHHLGHLLEEAHEVCEIQDGSAHFHAEEHASHSCVLCVCTSLNFHSDKEVVFQDPKDFFPKDFFSYNDPVVGSIKFLPTLRGPPSSFLL